MRSLFLHFVTFRFVLYYFVAFFLSSVLGNMVLDLDRSVSIDAALVKESLIDEIQKVKELTLDIEKTHGFSAVSGFVPMSGGENQALILDTLLDDDSSTSEYSTGVSRKQWLMDNIPWFFYTARFLPLIFLIHLLWFGWPASRVYHQYLKGAPSDSKYRHVARQRILGLSRIGMIHGCLMALIFGMMQWICEFHYLPYSGDRWLLIPLSTLSFGLSFGALIMGLFDPLILSLVPRLCQDEEIYQSRHESWFPGIAFRIRLMIVSGIVLPFIILFLSQVIYNPLIRTFFAWLIQEEHDPTAVIHLIPEILHAGLGFFVLMISLIIGIVLGRGILRSLAEPLESLALRMDKVRSGDFSQRTSVLANDEIGRTKSHFNSMVFGLKQRNVLEDSINRYVGPEVTSHILSTGDLKLGGKETEVAILISDIRNFTRLSETMEPSDVMSLLNEYFAEAVSEIQSQGGVVNKYIGDSVLAIFGAPLPLLRPADMAVRAAIGMQMRLEEWNRERKKKGLLSIQTGIGIHYGPVVVGNLGSRNRLEYTVIGDTVNVASRIESMTKVLGASIVISDVTEKLLGEEVRKSVRLKAFHNLKIKGKSSPSKLWGLHLKKK
ncbi:MAG: adenylate/guanylate cyclase domain-containing protein [Candidatus Cloacimonetes bacterium]|nr:adenylate/guanylate cyclase domain-containing protein [Candidatus Cloacimonadota bacterium]